MLLRRAGRGLERGGWRRGMASLAGFGLDVERATDYLVRGPKFARVDNLLLNASLIGRRREARGLLKENEVVGRTMQGEEERISSGSTRVAPESVRINSIPLEDQGLVHVVMHKPAGVVCSRSREEGETVYDLLPPDLIARRPTLHTVGRLDKWTSGVLLLTQSGELSNRLTSHKWPVRRVYEVELDGAVGSTEVDAFASGQLQIADDKGGVARCRPAVLQVGGERGRRVRVEMWEGRHHQVRRMFQAVGRQVLSLTRSVFGPITLDSISDPWRRLEREEIKQLLIFSSTLTPFPPLPFPASPISQHTSLLLQHSSSLLPGLDTPIQPPTPQLPTHHHPHPTPLALDNPIARQEAIEHLQAPDLTPEGVFVGESGEREEREAREMAQFRREMFLQSAGLLPEGAHAMDEETLKEAVRKMHETPEEREKRIQQLRKEQYRAREMRVEVPAHQTNPPNTQNNPAPPIHDEGGQEQDFEDDWEQVASSVFENDRR